MLAVVDVIGTERERADALQRRLVRPQRREHLARRRCRSSPSIPRLDRRRGEGTRLRARIAHRVEPHSPPAAERKKEALELPPMPDRYPLPPSIGGRVAKIRCLDKHAPPPTLPQPGSALAPVDRTRRAKNAPVALPRVEPHVVPPWPEPPAR